MKFDLPGEMMRRRLRLPAGSILAWAQQARWSAESVGADLDLHIRKIPMVEWARRGENLRIGKFRDVVVISGFVPVHCAA